MKRHLATFLLILICSLMSAQEENIAILHGPYLQNVNSDEATIVWVSNLPSVGWVEIAPDDGTNFYAMERAKIFDSRHGIKNQGRIHRVRLQGLTPGTTYRYRIYSTQIKEHRANYICYGPTAATDVYNKAPLKFRTLDPAQKEVSFAMVNDIHGDVAKMESLLKQCDMDKTDMILFVGDMVSQFNSEEQVFGGFMDKAVELFASQKPMFYTRGNHETRGEIAYDFQDYFSPSQDHIYYMFRQGPVCFVALDCGEDKPDSDIEYSDANVYSEYRTEQAEWLKKVIQTEEFKSAPFKIVTCHMPPMGGWFGPEEIKQKFIPILNEAGVDILLCGHTHRHSFHKAGELANFPVMVNSAKEVLKCNVDGKNLKIETVGTDGKVTDTFSLKK